MTTTFLQFGSVVTVTAPAAVSSDDIVQVGDLIGVAQADADFGAEAEIQIDGVYELPKDGSSISQGDTLYYDSAGDQVTPDSAGNTPIGVALTDQAGGDATVETRLLPGLGRNAVAVTLDLDDIASAETGYVAAPVAGVISRVQSVIEDEITGTSVLDTQIGGVDVTGGDVSVDADTAGAVDEATPTPTAANVVAVGDAISVVSDGNGTAANTAVPARVTLTIEPV